MSQRCKTCAHPDIAKIDSLLAGNIPYARIASDFGLSAKMVERHAKQHAKPIIEKAKAAAEKVIVNQILKYRKEVNFPLLDKVKLLQERILNDMDRTRRMADRVPLFREFRGSLQEEAKLAGAYQQDRKNDADVDRVVEAYRLWEQWFGSPNAEEQQTWIGWLSDKSGISATEITQKIKVQEISESIQ